MHLKRHLSPLACLATPLVQINYFVKNNAIQRFYELTTKWTISIALLIFKINHASTGGKYYDDFVKNWYDVKLILVPKATNQPWNFTRSSSEIYDVLQCDLDG